MENKIKHFIVDLSEVKDESPYGSDSYQLACKIEKDLEELIRKIRYNE